jgi:hypothetical protein
MSPERTPRGAALPFFVTALSCEISDHLFNGCGEVLNHHYG